ncbi:MAG: sensor histidine kinase [Acidimicrobiia bacterium]
MAGSALVPAPVARLNRGLLGLRVALYAVVLAGLWMAHAPWWVLVGVVSVVAFPAIRLPFLYTRRVHYGVGSSIVLEFLLWLAHGPLPGLEYVPIVSVSVAALVLSRRAAAIAWAGAVMLQTASVVLTAERNGSDMVAGEMVALVLLVMVGPAFRGIAAVLSDLRDELAERVREQTRLTEIVAEKDRFLEGAAHTLRTPLTGVLGLAEVVDAGELDPTEQRELVRTIVSEGRRLVRAVDNVIVGSRLPMGRVELLAKPVDLASAASSVAGGRATVDGHALGSGDPARVMTVIGNLIDNAESHGRDPIVVTVWEADGRAFFEVADEGPGIPPEYRDAVFDRYDTRIDNFTQPAPMGLGLPVSRQLLQAMGGDLTCVGNGNRFRGWIPVSRESAPVRHG